MKNERIVLCTVEEGMSLEDWERISQEIVAAIDSTSNDIHLIVDMLNMTDHPTNVVKIKNVTVWAGHKRLLTVSHLTKSRLVNILGDTVIAMTMGRSYKVMDSLESAFVRVKSEDSTITQSVDELLQEANSLQ